MSMSDEIQEYRGKKVLIRFEGKKCRFGLRPRCQIRRGHLRVGNRQQVFQFKPLAGRELSGKRFFAQSGAHFGANVTEA